MRPMKATVPEELLDELTKRFPNKTPTPKDRIEDIMFRAGRQAVLDFLKEQLDIQSKTILR